MINFNWKPSAQGNRWLMLIVVLAAFLFRVFNWGLPLILGWVGGVVGTQALPYLTPLGAIFGLLALFGIVRELTTGNKPAAWLASLLLMLTPAFWYYHSRSFFHNALFLDFLLAAIYVALL